MLPNHPPSHRTKNPGVCYGYGTSDAGVRELCGHETEGSDQILRLLSEYWLLTLWYPAYAGVCQAPLNELVPIVNLDESRAFGACEPRDRLVLDEVLPQSLETSAKVTA
jgi:hypothetical protein